MTPDQVEDAGWTLDVWNSLNEIARSTIESVAQVRRIIPPGPELPNAYLVELPEYDSVPPASYTVTQTKPVTRIRHQFKVKSEQLHDVVLIRRLVQQIAMRVAHAEDLVLAHGAGATLLPAAAFKGSSVGHALALVGAPAGSDTDVIAAFSLAARLLRGKAIAGPLHAAVGFDAWSTLARLESSSKVPGPEKARVALGSSDSLLVCLPPDPATNNHITILGPGAGGVDLVWTLTPRISHVGTLDGDLILCIEEAFCLRILDPSATTTVEMTVPNPPKKSG